MLKNLLIGFFIAVTFIACSRDSQPLIPPESHKVSLYTFKIINTFSHDSLAFTQGLIYVDSVFYEGTGLYGHSGIRVVDPASGTVMRQSGLDQNYFGEGITLYGNKIYQLTWLNEVAFVYEPDNLNNSVKQYSYTGEGWGLTHNGRELIMSNGSSTICFRDPETFDIIRSIEVSDNGAPVENLNELEFVEGLIYANIWYSDIIVMISPTDGRVVGKIDLSGLLPSNYDANVLNGIAWDEEGRRLFVTGKLWPFLYEIELIKTGEE